MNNSSFPPLYPQEAYPEQNNFSNFQSSNPPQSQQNNGGVNPLAALLGGLGQNSGMSALMPLLVKMMSGNTNNEALFDSNNPLMGIINSIGNQNKKNSPPQKHVEEKKFPEF